MDWSLPEEIGLSAVISVGNQADMSFENLLIYAGDDPYTRAIILYVEEIRDGPVLSWKLPAGSHQKNLLLPSSPADPGSGR